MSPKWLCTRWALNYPAKVIDPTAPQGFTLNDCSDSDDDEKPASGDETDTVETLEIATYNVGFLRGFENTVDIRRDATIAAAASVDADVLCL